MIRVFIGYDSKLPVLYNVAQHSIQVRASQPVSITPIMLSQLKGIYTRDVNPLASTEFHFHDSWCPTCLATAGGLCSSTMMC